MKQISTFVLAALLLVVLHPAATASDTSESIKPFTWDAAFSPLDFPFGVGQGLSVPLSAFTLPRAVTVIRVQYTASMPPREASTGQGLACTVSPTLKITDGTRSYSLKITSGSNFNDSGALSLRFPAGATILATYLLGGSTQQACQSFWGNMTVQYSVRE